MNAETPVVQEKDLIIVVEVEVEIIAEEEIIENIVLVTVEIIEEDQIIEENKKAERELNHQEAHQDQAEALIPLNLQSENNPKGKI